MGTRTAAGTPSVGTVAGEVPGAVADVAAPVVAAPPGAAAVGKLDEDRGPPEDGLAVVAVDGTLRVLGVGECDETVAGKDVDIFDGPDLGKYVIGIAPLYVLTYPANVHPTLT